MIDGDDAALWLSSLLHRSVTFVACCCFLQNIVTSTITVYNTIVDELLPTPAKPHYTFNLRDLSKVFQGCLMGEAKKVRGCQGLAGCLPGGLSPDCVCLLCN